jgi:hypothetical protein
MAAKKERVKRVSGGVPRRNAKKPKTQPKRRGNGRKTKKSG